MKTTQVRTQGVLNKVCRHYNCNAKKKTISIQDLIRKEKPENAVQLRNLIESHKGKGCIDKWAENLYECYLKYKAINPHIAYKNIEDCKIFMNYLFVEGSIKGGRMEQFALKTLNKQNVLKDFNYTAVMGSEIDDFKYSVDILIKDENNDTICGIQVKPASYRTFAEHNKDGVHAANVRKNKDFGKPVLYMYYDMNGYFKDEEFNKDYINLLYEHKNNSRVKITL